MIIKEIGLQQTGCDNGNYPTYALLLENGAILLGTTCRCQKGCSGTDNIANLNVGDECPDDIGHSMHQVSNSKFGSVEELGFYTIKSIN